MACFQRDFFMISAESARKYGKTFCFQLRIDAPDPLLFRNFPPGKHVVFPDWITTSKSIIRHFLSIVPALRWIGGLFLVIGSPLRWIGWPFLLMVCAFPSDWSPPSSDGLSLPSDWSTFPSGRWVPVSDGPCLSLDWPSFPSEAAGLSWDRLGLPSDGQGFPMDRRAPPIRFSGTSREGAKQRRRERAQMIRNLKNLRAFAASRETRQ